MVYVLLIAMVCLSIVVGLEFEAISNARVDARHRSLQTWHQVICRIEVTAVATHGISDAKKRMIVRFYDGLLENIGAEPCGLNAG